jgi:hypothetical protein
MISQLETFKTHVFNTNYKYKLFVSAWSAIAQVVSHQLPTVAGFLRVLRLPLPIFILTALHSSCQPWLVKQAK